MTVGGVSEPESESVHVSASTSASASVTASPSSSTVASPSAKRCRDPEDEVYVDNLHSHKRYLSEVSSCLFWEFEILYDYADQVFDLELRIIVAKNF